jgi:hypothetical protein
LAILMPLCTDLRLFRERLMRARPLALDGGAEGANAKRMRTVHALLLTSTFLLGACGASTPPPPNSPEPPRCLDDNQCSNGLKCQKNQNDPMGVCVTAASATPPPHNSPEPPRCLDDNQCSNGQRCVKEKDAAMGTCVPH